MLLENCLKNPVSLQEIKSEKILAKYRLILKEDIWKKGLLLLRSGLFLSEELIDKLMNFGIFEINVLYQDNGYEEEYMKVLKRNFLSSKNVYIIDPDLKNAVYWTNILADIGYKIKNIYTLTNAKYAASCFKDKNPDYLIIDYESNSEDIIDILEKVNKHTHIFIIVDKNSRTSNKFNELENNVKLLEIHYITKSISPGYFLNSIYKCIDYDFSELFNKKTLY